MILRAVRRKRVYQDIVGQIQRLLATGRLKSGEKLPSERELSEMFRVSRASVREAIRALESMGLMEIRSGEGTYVASTVETFFSPLASSLRKEKDAILEIFEARRTLEPEIAALAARRASAAQIKHLDGILEGQARQIAAGKSGVEEDTAFHSALAQITGNKVLLGLNNAIVDNLSAVRKQSLQTRGRPARSLAGHRRVLEAIRAGDPARAKKAMREHLEAIELNILGGQEKRGKAPGKGFRQRLSRKK